MHTFQDSPCIKCIVVPLSKRKDQIQLPGKGKVKIDMQGHSAGNCDTVEPLRVLLPFIEKC